MLSGADGTGKGHMVRELCRDLGLALRVVDAGPLSRSGRAGAAEESLRAAFEGAKESRALVYIRDLELLCPKREAGSASHEVRAVAQLLTLLDGLSDASHTVVVASSGRPGALDAALRRPGRFDRELAVTPPSVEERAAILHALLAPSQPSDAAAELAEGIASLGLGSPRAEAAPRPAPLAGPTVAEIASMCAGFVYADLASLVRLAADQLVARGGGGREELLAAVVQCVPLVRPSVRMDAEGMTDRLAPVSWDDIGGTREAKLRLKEALEWPLLHPERFRAFGVRAARGVLLAGPPGVSKTMLVRAAATAVHAAFFCASGASLYSMYFGEAERHVRGLFSAARMSPPAVIFIDELDAVVGKRGGDDGAGSDGTKDRILSTLLNEMDGVAASEGVLVVGATNRPDMIDDALLRPGRFDVTVHVPLPSAADREDILRVIARDVPTSPDVDWAEMAARTEGLSGAELQGFIRESAMAAIREAHGGINVVTKDHLDQWLRGKNR